MSFRLYQLSGAGCGTGGKVLNTLVQQKASTTTKTKQPETAIVSKPVPKPSGKTNPTIEDLQQKLQALSALKTKKNGKKYVSL